MQYQFASAADFAADDFFIQWVKAPTLENDRYWRDWLQQNPSKHEVLQEARELVLLLSEGEEETHEQDIDEVWQKLQQEIRSEERDGAVDTPVIPIGLWQRYGALVAASVGLLLVVGIYMLSLLRMPAVEYATAQGEKRTVVLPDSSVVVLNANSSIAYTEGWSAREPRVVHLKGEAYFSVVHQLNHQKFIVQTPDGTEVEVLGTEFDVATSARENRVVLASGKVRLSFAQGDEEQQLTMKPGELVEVTGRTGEVLRKQVSPELYTSWKDNKIIFDDTSLREIANMVERVYGYKVVIADAALADQKISATLDDRGVDNILSTVSETLGVTVQKQDNTITIRQSTI